MATCTVTLEQDGLCGTVSSSVKKRLWRADYDLFNAAYKAGEITIVNGLITTFAPTAPFLYELVQPENSVLSPTATSKLSADGIGRFGQSIIFYVVDNGSLTTEQLSKIANKRQVYIYENTATSTDGHFKVFGFDSGLVVADGGIVRNAGEGGGSAMITATTNENDYESFADVTIFSTTYAATLAAIEAAVV